MACALDSYETTEPDLRDAGLEPSLLADSTKPTRGFQRMATAYATIKGFEVMRMIRRGHYIRQQPGATGEIRFVNQLFGLDT
jgi:hypothetical protein